jgi:wyosine [tRNA(Phe)-imidazoG37] synthetase (radical SAM superfamily)
MREFRKIFSGKLWLEVFILKGVNDKPADVAKIAALAESIAPDSIQLNTVVRPPAESSAQPISHSDLLHLAPLFSPPAEIIARFSSDSATKETPHITAEHILAMLMRRPCTADDITDAFRTNSETTAALIEKLINSMPFVP